jgi:hypothetical protein
MNNYLSHLKNYEFAMHRVVFYTFTRRLIGSSFKNRPTSAQGQPGT